MASLVGAVIVFVWQRRHSKSYVVASVRTRCATDNVVVAPAVSWHDVQVSAATWSQLTGAGVGVPPSGAALEWQYRSPQLPSAHDQ